MQTALMRSVLTVLSALALGISACAIPGRDNPNDPQNAPAAKLTVVDLSVPGSLTVPAPCMALTSAGTATGAASRGRCLALDARGTTRDPGVPTFEFFWLDTSLTAHSIQAVSPSPVVAIPSAVLRSFRPGQSVNFKVRVTDEGGTSFATAPFTPLNGRPVAAVDPARTIPVGGFPWAPGAPIQVTFHGSASHDPDGDPLTFQWTFSDTGAMAASTSADVTRSVPVTNAGKILATLVVNDGNLSSGPTASGTLTIGGPNLWTQEFGQGVFERLDPAATTILPPQAAAVLVLNPYQQSLALVGDQVVAFYPENPSGELLAIAPWPSGTPFSAPAAAPDSGSVSAAIGDPAHGQVWAYRNSFLERYSVAPGSLTFEGATNIAALDPSLSGLQPALLEVDGEGDLWLTGDGDSSDLLRFSSSGVFLSSDAEPSFLFTGTAHRPGSSPDEIWTLQDPNFFSAGAASASKIALWVGGVETQAWTLPATYAFGLAFSGPDDLWIQLEQVGLFRIDVGLLEAGSSFQDATVVSAPAIAGVNQLLADPSAGRAYAITTDASQSVRVEADGTETSLAVGFPESLQFIDPLGVIAYEPAGVASSTGAASFSVPTFAAGLAPALTGVVDQFDDQGFGLAYDLGSGGLWEVEFVPPALVLRSEDSRILLDVPFVQTASGQSEPFPFITSMAAAPDGTALYGFPFVPTTRAFTGLDRIDLGVNPPRVTQILDEATASSLVPYQVLQPSAPVPASTPFVWVAKSTPQPGLYAMTPDGGLAPLPLAAISEWTSPVRVASALSPSTNDLCMAFVQPGTSNVLVRWVSPSGTVTNVATIAYDPGAYLSASVWADAGGETCWIGIGANIPDGHPTLVNAYDSTGALRHTFSQATSTVRSVLGTSADQVWITWEGPLFESGQLNKARLDFVPKSGGALAAPVVALPVTAPVELIAPFGSNAG